MTAVLHCTEFCDHDTLHRRWARVSLECWPHESVSALHSAAAAVIEVEVEVEAVDVHVLVPVHVRASPGSGHNFHLMLIG